MFLVEGNIGTGKSTFVKKISKFFPHIQVCQEPVENWQQAVYGSSLLENFYKDPYRWAYTLETFAMACRVRQQLKDQLNSSPLCLIERSIYSGHYVFAFNSYEQGFLNGLEWELYNEWFAAISHPCLPPKGFIYLRSEPETAYERIKKRSRDAENSISLDYIRQIHNRHETFLISKQGVSECMQQTPVLVLDCNQEFEQDDLEFKIHAEKIFDFMYCLK